MSIGPVFVGQGLPCRSGGGRQGLSGTGANVSRISILGMMILVVLCALIIGLFARLHEEAIFYITGPLLGAMLAAWADRRDRAALIKGGVLGGFCQGIIAVMLLKRGYIFPDIAMMTGALFLETLVVHLFAGLTFGTLLYLAFRWALPTTRRAPRHVIDRGE